MLTWPHLAVSGFIGVFSMLQFAVQLLQLVHGRHDPNLRVPATLDVLAEMGVVEPGGVVVPAEVECDEALAPSGGGCLRL